MRAYPKGGGARATLQRHDPQGLLTTDEAVDETRIRALFFGDVACSVQGAGATATCTRRAKLQLLHPELPGLHARKVIGVSSLKIVSRISGILMNTHLHHTWVRVLAVARLRPPTPRGPASPMRCGLTLVSQPAIETPPVFLIEWNGKRGGGVPAPKASHPASAATQRVRAT
jgi:hypothetical protein